jgi:hypothetical protein
MPYNIFLRHTPLNFAFLPLIFCFYGSFFSSRTLIFLFSGLIFFALLPKFSLLSVYLVMPWTGFTGELGAREYGGLREYVGYGRTVDYGSTEFTGVRGLREYGVHGRTVDYGRTEFTGERG